MYSLEALPLDNICRTLTLTFLPPTPLRHSLSHIFILQLHTVKEAISDLFCCCCWVLVRPSDARTAPAYARLVMRKR